MQTAELEKLNSQMSNRELFDRGVMLIDEIKQLETNNLNFHVEIEVMNRTIKEYLDHAIESVNKATDDEGKKKYTNESQRIVARRNFLRDSQKYNQLIENLNSMKSSIKTNEIEINYRKYRLRLINSYMRQTPE